VVSEASPRHPVFLWWLADDDRLKKAEREAIRNPENDVYLSAASIWETVIKQGRPSPSPRVGLCGRPASGPSKRERLVGCLLEELTNSRRPEIEGVSQAVG